MDIKNALKTFEDINVCKWKEIQSGLWGIDVGMQLKNGDTRFQYVSIQLAQKGKKEMVILHSQVGPLHSYIKSSRLLRDNRRTLYSKILLQQLKDKNGKIIENISVQANLLAEHFSNSLFQTMLTEVAERADILEEQYYGEDLH